METATRTDWIATADAAKMLRTELKKTFPGVKFSVRCDYGSIRVSYTDGPALYKVNEIANLYAGEGFDGMIDMRYSYRHYLMPDGTLVDGGTRGTQGSGGAVPESYHTCPEDARPVRLGVSFVSVDRGYTAVSLSQIVATVSAHYGETPPVVQESYGRPYYVTNDFHLDQAIRKAMQEADLRAA